RTARRLQFITKLSVQMMYRWRHSPCCLSRFNCPTDPTPTRLRGGPIMPAATPTQTASLTRSAGLSHGIEHDSFDDPDAATEYDPRPALRGATEYAIGYMPDEVTRDFGRRMHYAAYRARRAVRVRDR